MEQTLAGCFCKKTLLISLWAIGIFFMELILSRCLVLLKHLINPIGDWKLSSGIDFERMFQYAFDFRQDLTPRNVSTASGH